MTQEDNLNGLFADEDDEQAQICLDDAAMIAIELKEKAERLDEELKATKASYEIASAELISLMQQQGVDAFKTQSRNISYKPYTKAWVNKDQKQEQFEWLREIGQGSLVKEEVNYNTFQSFVNKDLPTMKDVEIPDFVNTKKLTKLKIAKVRGSK